MNELNFILQFKKNGKGNWCFFDALASQAEADGCADRLSAAELADRIAQPSLFRVVDRASFDEHRYACRKRSANTPPPHVVGQSLSKAR